MNYKNISATILTLLLVIFFGWLFFFYDGNTHEGHNHTTETQITIWTCSMHPQIKQDKAGKCPICAMDLVPLNTVATEDSNNMDVQMSEAAAKLADIQNNNSEKRKSNKRDSFTRENTTRRKKNV